jgi:hypothetical protein
MLRRIFGRKRKQQKDEETRIPRSFVICVLHEIL